VFLGWFLACLSVSATFLLGASGPDPAVVDWSDVRSALRERVRVEATAGTEPDDPAWRVLFDVETEGPVRADMSDSSDSFRAAVRDGLHRADPFRIEIPGAYRVEEEYRRHAPNGDGDDVPGARELLDALPDLEGMLAARVIEELGRTGRTCSGCPDFWTRALPVDTWEEFAPYVAYQVGVFVRGADQVGFKICSGSGVPDLRSQEDRVRFRAAYILVQRSPAFKMVVQRLLMGIYGTETRGADADVWTRELRARLVATSDTRDAVCRSYREYAAGFLVRLKTCEYEHSVQEPD
jgi:hypothetical protein